MRSNRIKIIFISLLFCFGLSSCDTFNAYLGGRKKTLNSKKVAFFVYSNTKVDQLIDSLVKHKIIDDVKAFKDVITYKSFTNHSLGAGKYSILPHTKYKTLINGFTINRLGNGNKEEEVDVTFNNCRDINVLAGKVAKQLEMDSAQFVNYISSDSVLQKYGFNKATIPALFLPNTYRFYWDTGYKEFTRRMADEFKNFWTPERKRKLKEVGLKDPSDAVTLASIVYKEQSQNPQEWKIIARLYLNRLVKGMKLESDPTFRFCWGEKLDGVERLTFKDAQIDCPYNTYKYAGLPPGPICIPPTQTIDAVLNPDQNDYLFMCAKPNSEGLHNFARTLRQHARNAQKYHEWMSNRKR